MMDNSNFLSSSMNLALSTVDDSCLIAKSLMLWSSSSGQSESEALITSCSSSEMGAILLTNRLYFCSSLNSRVSLILGTSLSALQSTDSSTQTLTSIISVSQFMGRQQILQYTNTRVVGQYVQQSCLSGNASRIQIIIKLQWINNFIKPMDQRLYHYQYRRPRLSNPTYSSFNVNSSMTFFMNNPNSNNNVQRKSTYEDTHNLQNSNSYFNNDLARSGGEMAADYGSYTPRESRERTQSHLSNYGNNSLAFNEREIYNKQHSNFNIISLKPKEVPDRIKQYPKLTLEDKDNYYYKKVQMMREQEANSTARNGSLPSRYEGNVAGKHTFAPEQGKSPAYYQQGRYFTPKMLNHADQVGNIM